MDIGGNSQQTCLRVIGRDAYGQRSYKPSIAGPRVPVHDHTTRLFASATPAPFLLGIQPGLNGD